MYNQYDTAVVVRILHFDGIWYANPAVQPAEYISAANALVATGAVKSRNWRGITIYRATAKFAELVG